MRAFHWALLLLPPVGCGTQIAAATIGSGSTAEPGDSGVSTGPDGSTGTIHDGGVIPFDANLPADGGDFCTGTGPVIPVPGANRTCSGDLGATTFLFAVCSCSDIKVSGNLLTNSLPTDDSGIPGNGGSIGANGVVATNSTLQVNGSIWAEGEADAAAALHVEQASTVTSDVHANGPIEADQPLTIGGNLYANGNITGSVSCNSADLPSKYSAPGLVTDGGRSTAAVAIPAPCDCTDVLDIPSIVTPFSGASANTDSLVGLTPASFAPFPSTPE